LPLSVESTTSNALLHQDDYPKVKSWTKQAWDKLHSALEHKGNAGIHQWSTKSKGKPLDPSKTLGFVKNVNGININQMEASNFISHAQVIWTHLKSLGLTPETCMKASVDATAYFCQKMYQYRPDLQLSEAHWKVIRIAVDNHPSWHWGQCNRNIKEEPENMAPTVNPKYTKKGSKTEDASDSPFKKQKVEKLDNENNNIIMLTKLASADPNTLSYAAITPVLVVPPPNTSFY
jgi:hypothetical protein